MFNKKNKIIIIVLLGSIYNITIIGISVFLMKLIDSIVKISYKEFKTATLQLMTAYIIQIIIYGIYSHIKYKYINKQMAELKSNIYFSIMNKNMTAFYKVSIDEYISFLFKHIDLLKEKYYINVINIIENIILFILSLLAIIYIYPYYLIVVILVIILSMIFPIVFSKRGKNLIDKLSKLNKINIEWIRNSLEGYRIVNTFKINEKICIEAYEVFSKYQLEESKMDILLSYLEIGLQLILSLVTVITFVAGGIIVTKGGLTIGALIALVQLILNATNPLMSIASSINNIKSTEGIREKCKELLSQNKIKGLQLFDFSYEYPLEFIDVTFSYPEEEKSILENFNFKFERGKKYCLIGSNGSGKSTLLKLAFGMFNNYKGKILLYGVDIRDLDDRSIFHTVSYLKQEVFIFNKNLKDNILVEREGEEALKALKIMEEMGLNRRTKNKDNIIMHNSLSGGEIKKIGISRMLSRKSPILLVDEGDSDLDNDGLKSYFKILKEEDRDLVLAISHRLLDNDVFDEIIDLDERKLEKV